jgi:type VI secretion system secreted protein VgrG
MIAAGTTTSISAGQDINLAVQGNSSHAVQAGISLFTYGKASNKHKPCQDTGIRLHAASGKVSIQSQSGATQVTADKAVTVASVTKSVKVAAKDHVLLAAQGAYLRLSDGNIEIHGPGTMSFKATMKELAGPRSNSLALPALPKSQAIVDELDRPLFSQQIVAPEANGRTPEYAGVPYQIWKRGKPVQIASGTLDENGMSTRVFTDVTEDLTVIVGDASWEVIVPTDGEPTPKGDPGE